MMELYIIVVCNTHMPLGWVITCIKLTLCIIIMMGAMDM